MNKIPQSNDELHSHLYEQLGFIRNSAAAVDRGDISEAKRIAVAIRILLHDKKEGRSKSLLGQLDMKDGNFYSTACDISHEELLRKQALLGIRGNVYCAKLDDGNPLDQKWIPFQEWWNQPVFLDENKRTISRQKLVLFVADQDGGAHVDSDLPEVYVDLSRNNSAGWTLCQGNSEQPLGPNPALLSIRQIAHEILKTIEKKR